MSGIGIGVIALGLACGITSTALDYWYYFSLAVQDETENAYFGLWELCAKNTKESACTSWSFLSDKSDDELDITWLQACQAMMIIGVVLNALACIVAIKQMPNWIAKQAACVGGICYLIAAVIFFAKYEDIVSDDQTDGNLHAGFGLAIAAGLINLISSCVLGPGQAQNGGGYVQV